MKRSSIALAAIAAIAVLAGLPAQSRRELEISARIAVQALDPCVACRVEVADA